MGAGSAGKLTENTPFFAHFCYGGAFYWFFTNKFVILKIGCKEFPL